MRQFAAQKSDSSNRPPRTAIRVLGITVIAGMMCAGIAYSQTPPAPNADKDAMYEHVKKAQKIAGLDLYPAFSRRCLVDQSYRNTISQSNQAFAAMEPLKVFDNLYFLGHNAVSAWALTTSHGIILFDSLDNPEEAKTFIVGGMAKVGLNPTDIKYLVITHGHGDHFGGAKYLKETYPGMRLMASKIDWDFMAKSQSAPARPPRADDGKNAAGGRGGPPAEWAKLVPDHDLDIEDAQKLTLGDATVTFYITPPHTPGAVTTVFKVTDQGQPHVAAIYGSFSIPASLEDKKVHLATLARWRGIAQAAGVDTLIANHQTQDQSVDKLELLRLRRAGDPNPYVIGKEAYLRLLDVMSECTLFAEARAGQK